METQEFISKYLLEARRFLSTSDAAELSLYVVFYLSLNKDRIQELRNKQAHYHSTDFVASVYKDFSNLAEKNSLLEDNFFHPALSRINTRANNDETVTRIFYDFINYYSSQKEINFSIAFNLLLEFLIDNNNYEVTDFYLSKQEANLLFDENLKKYLSDCKIVYFPFLKNAKDVILLEKFGLSKDCLILANEINEQICSIAKMNLIINGFTNFQIEKEIAFDNLPLSYQGKIDFIFSSTPFRMELKNNNIQSITEQLYKNNTKKPYFLNGNKAESSLLMTELSLQLVSEKGKVLAYEAGSFLYSSSLKEYRKSLVENQYIDKIIKRGKYGKSTSVSIELILFDKNTNRSESQNIIFFTEDKIFTLNTLLFKNSSSPFNLSKNGYNLSSSIYLHPYFSELSDQLKNSTHLAKISDVVATIKKGSPIAPIEQSKDKKENSVPYVRLRDLSQKNSVLDLSKVDTYVENSTDKIDYSCVLISILGADLKAIHFNYEGVPIVISSAMFAITLKNTINLNYFIYQLQTRLVKIQVEMLSKGSTIKRLYRTEFLDIQFVLPSLEEQEKQLFEIKSILAKQVSVQQEVDEILNQAKYSDYQLIASVAHSFKNKISPLLMDYKTLKNFLDKKEGLDLNESVRPIFEGETAEDVDTFRNIIDRIEKQLATLPKIFNDVKILQKQELDTKQENISDFIKSVISNYKNIDYKIKVIPSKKPLFVLLDSEAFRSVLENLIDNAKNHAFKSMDNKENCKIEFEIKKVEEKINGVGGEYAQIIYKDNGKGFPKGYTFESYKLFGNKSIQSDGTGIGGFIISKIIELHEGTINLLSTNPSDEFTTQISILLPLS